MKKHRKQLGPLRRFFARQMLNYFPPYLGTGIRVAYMSADLHEVVIEMKRHWYNKNYVGTHFGGSLYAMTDPIYMLMLIHILGNAYIVWDKAAEIEFIKPGRADVRARFVLTEEIIEEIKAKTAGGEKFLPQFIVDIQTPDGTLIARVKKTLYIRLKKEKAVPNTEQPDVN